MAGCRASLNSFSFIWLNPPFDYAYGGHRVEDQFLQTATNWLMPGGVLPREPSGCATATPARASVNSENTVRCSSGVVIVTSPLQQQDAIPD